MTTGQAQRAATEQASSGGTGGDALLLEPTAPVSTGAPRPPRTEGQLAATAAGTAGTRIAMMAITLLTGVVTARLLGPHDRGQVAVSFASASIFSAICTGGLETANLRFAGGSAAMHRYAVWHSLRYVATVGIGVAAAWGAVGLALWSPARFGLDPAAFALTLTVGVVALLSTLLGTAEIARTRAATYNATIIGGLLVFAALLGVLALRDDATPVTVVAAYLIGQVVGAVVLGVRGRPARRHAGDPGGITAYRTFARRAYLPNLAQFAMGRTQVPVIQLLAGSAAVGVYSVALPIAETLLILPVALSLILVPAVANGDADWPVVTRMAVRTLLLTVLGAGVLAAAAPVAVPLVFGPGFAESVQVLWALLPGLVILSSARTAQSYLTAVDRPGPITLAAVLATTAGALAMVLLIPRHAAVGAGIAVSVAYTSYALVILAAFVTARPHRSAHRSGPAGPWVRSGAMTGGLVAAGAVALGVGGGVLAGLDTALLARIAAAATLVCVFAVPRLGLYLLAAALPATQLPFPVAPDTSPLLALVLCGLVGALLRRRSLRGGVKVPALVVALLVALVIGAALGGQLDEASNSLVALALVVIGVPLMATAARDDRGRALLVFGLVSTVVAGVQTTLGILGVRDVVATDPDLGDALSLLNHNTWGPMLVLTLGVLLAQAAGTASRSFRLLLALCVAVVLAGVGFSYSRSSYLGAIVVLVYFVGRRRLAAPLTVVGVAAVVTIGLSGLKVVPDTIADRVDYTTAGGRLDGSSSVRLDLWASALRMAVDHPLSGVGFLGFERHLPGYFSRSVTGVGTDVSIDLIQHPHNMYLTVLAETGLVGTLLLGALVVVVVRRVRRTGPRWTGEAALLALAGVGAASLFGEPLLTLPVLGAFLIVVATAIRRPA